MHNSSDTNLRKFIIEFIEPSTGCIDSEIVIETTEIAKLCDIIDPGSATIHPAASYDLEHGELEQIKQQFFGLSDEGSCCDARFRSWRALDELPYKVHTNRELTLMLSGNKPLAVFSEQLPAIPNLKVIPERYFDPYVSSGRFVKRECVLPSSGERKTRIVFYANKSEEWRIEAYILLKITAEKAGWSEGFERFEGSLLGYEEWQNDVYIEKIYNRGNTSR